MLKWNDHAIPHLGLTTQRGFEVIGINVHAFAVHNDVFLAPAKIEAALGIDFAEIAGAEPAFFVQYRLQLFALPISGSNVGAAHQDFAIVVELHLAAFQHLADGALAGAKRMIERDERSGLRQPVPLDDYEAQPTPELLGRAIKRRPAGDEGPELPSELVVNAAETPPAPDEMLALGGSELLLEPRPLARGFEVALDLVFQRLHQARYGNHHRHALFADQLNDLGGIQAVVEDDRSGQ